MNPAVFVTEMREVAKLTQSQMVPGTLEAYEPRFASWSDEEFTVAIRKCGDELNRSPRLARFALTGQNDLSPLRTSSPTDSCCWPTRTQMSRESHR